MTSQLNDLIDRIHAINEKSGFNEYASTPAEFKKLYIGNKLMLVVSELAEAQEEIRSGRAVTDTYYDIGPVPASFAVEFASGVDANAAWIASQLNSEGPKKPEGFPSEIADAIIRLLSMARETGIDIEAVIEEKIAYNATRPFKHGKAF